MCISWARRLARVCPAEGGWQEVNVDASRCITAQPRGRFLGQDAASDLLTADFALAEGPVVNFLQSYGNFVLELEQLTLHLETARP